MKQLVAGRAAYQCSFPICNQLTIGPGAAATDISLTGVAAHIYSASPAGPRGQGGKPAEFLESATNAIWLCEHHGKLVDNNRGTQYPPAVLLSYKELHESRIARAHKGIYAPFAWFQELKVYEGPLFKMPVSVRFGKVTFLVGNNGTGKTALWQWLTGMSSPLTLMRWRRAVGKTQPVHFGVIYFSPDKQTMEVAISRTGSVSYVLNEKPVPFSPLSVRFVHVRSTYEMTSREREDSKDLNDVERLALRFHVDVVNVENILPLVFSDVIKRVGIREIDVESEDEDIAERKGVEGKPTEIYVEFSHGDILSYEQLSGGEEIEVLIAIGATLAKFLSEHAPTVLILSSIGGLDRRGILNWAARLHSPDFPFQTIIELAVQPSSLKEIQYTGMEIVALEGTRPNVRVDQPE